LGGEKRILRAWLNGRDIPCPCCKYNLRGLTSGRCPECGSPLKLSITAQAPLSYTIAMVAVGAALGVEAVYEFDCFTPLLTGQARCSLSAVAFDILVHFGLAAALAATMLLLLRARRWWWKLRDRTVAK
jgi:hypothetical protein